jgi:hypothetical protein
MVLRISTLTKDALQAVFRSQAVEVEGFTHHYRKRLWFLTFAPNNSSVFNGASWKEIQERELTFEHSYINRIISISEQNYIVHLTPFGHG